jgi:hypothetical protein
MIILKDLKGVNLTVRPTWISVRQLQSWLAGCLGYVQMSPDVTRCHWHHHEAGSCETPGLVAAAITNWQSCPWGLLCSTNAFNKCVQYIIFQHVLILFNFRTLPCHFASFAASCLSDFTSPAVFGDLVIRGAGWHLWPGWFDERVDQYASICCINM